LAKPDEPNLLLPSLPSLTTKNIWLNWLSWPKTKTLQEYKL